MEPVTGFPLSPIFLLSFTSSLSLYFSLIDLKVSFILFDLLLIHSLVSLDYVYLSTNLSNFFSATLLAGLVSLVPDLIIGWKGYKYSITKEVNKNK